MIATIQSYFETSTDKAWELLKKTDTFLFITRGFLDFTDTEKWPEEFYADLEINTKLIFFHILPAWKHCLKIIKINELDKELYSNECGGFIKTWNHLIKIDFETDCSCKYTDKVEIDAAFLTPAVWLYAKIFYRYRHYRWKKLINFRAI
ncbi:MAG: hypothetical protein HQK79_21565 [Desulfobacterales bacterium]|nr:hypothetical protein [Desulfobacterales bacterium]